MDTFIYIYRTYLYFSQQPSYFKPRVVSQSSSSSTLDCHFHRIRRDEVSALHRMEETSHFSTYIICSAFSPTNLIFLLFSQFLTCLHSFSLPFSCYTILLLLSSRVAFLSKPPASSTHVLYVYWTREKYISTFLQQYIFLMMMTKATMTLLDTTDVW